MNAEKIGTFIAKCRKVKGITQQQLADELNITNKAVSKWETGLGMPDITILPALAEILLVSVDELLNGEKVNINNSESVLINKATEYINHNNASNKATEYSTNKEISNEVTEYLINKSITRFHLVSLFSTALALMGIIVPYFIWLETNDYTGHIFGIWFEICSIGIFYAYYTITKNETKSYNKTASIKIDIKELRNNNMRVLVWLWTLMPVIFITSLICNVFEFASFIKVISILVLYLITHIVIHVKILINLNEH